MADVRETAALSGQPVYFVGDDANGEGTIWAQYPDEAEPRGVLQRCDVVRGDRAAHWAALTGHLPVLGE